jgi:hypothetical protein
VARIYRLLTDLFRQAIGAHRREAPFRTDSLVIAGSLWECFEPCLIMWRPPGAYEAHARGLCLLKENLSPTQRDQFQRHGYFDVVGGETGRRYRIRPGFQMNVEQLDKRGRCLRRLCFMPEGGHVIGDVMLAQKLALELFEADALKVANTLSPHFPLLGPMA